MPAPSSPSSHAKTAPELTAFAEESLGRARQALQALASAAPDRALAAFDEINASLDRAGNLCGLFRSVHPEEGLRAAAEAAEQKVSAFATALSLDRRAFDALRRVDPSGADPATRHYLERTLRDFRRAGVDKDEATRARVQALNDDLVKAGQEFDANIRGDVRSVRLFPASLAGLPEDWVRRHPPADDGRVTVTTDYPDAIPFMTYAKDGEARRSLYVASRNRAVPRNLEVLKSLLARRYELARILGYPNWAAYVTEDKMIGSDKAAEEFLERVSAAAENRMRADYAVLLARKRRDDPEATEVSDWERGYYEERVSAETYKFDSQEARPYLEYGRVKEGLFEVTRRMFGVEYRKLSEPAWHPEVESYQVTDAGSGVPLGRLHLDMHPREGKFKHAAMFPIVSGQLDRPAPEAALVCNFPRADNGTPALLEHDDVKTFFHEFGHLLHHLLGGHTRWAGISGIKTEWDFVEAPSQMLEEWVWDPETLRSFAVHHQTGKPIPSELVRAMRAAADFGKGLQVRHQMYYARLSLELYRRDPATVDSTDLSRELMNAYSPFRFVEGTRFEASFGHLDGYSAVYYTYMWSLVIAKDLFGTFKEKGLLDPATAARYRKAILEPGGSKKAADLVRDFLGRPSNFTAFESWLNEG